MPPRPRHTTCRRPPSAARASTAVSKYACAECLTPTVSPTLRLVPDASTTLRDRPTSAATSAATYDSCFLFSKAQRLPSSYVLVNELFWSKGTAVVGMRREPRNH